MLECTTIDDFDRTTADWFVVNDSVMGGRSEGGLATKDGSLVFEGTINTDGGGFSSIRRQMTPGAMEGATAVRLTALGDSRSYRMIFKTAARHNGRPISYQAEIPSDDGSEAVTLDVSLSDMRTSVFGRDVPAPPFDASDVEELGIIIADGKDGPFRLEIRSIEACR